MQVLVLYYSKTGNTEKLALEIAKGVQQVSGVTALVKSTQDVVKQDFLDSDGIIAGSPVYFGTMAAELKAVFDGFVSTRKKMEDKVGAAFTTAGYHAGGKETTIMSILQAFLIYGMIYVGDPMAASGHYGVACEGAPDMEAKNNGALLGKRVATLVQKLSA